MSTSDSRLFTWLSLLWRNWKSKCLWKNIFNHTLSAQIGALKILWDHLFGQYHHQSKIGKVYAYLEPSSMCSKSESIPFSQTLGVTNGTSLATCSSNSQTFLNASKMTICSLLCHTVPEKTIHFEIFNKERSLPFLSHMCSILHWNISHSFSWISLKPLSYL